MICIRHCENSKINRIKSWVRSLETHFAPFGGLLIGEFFNKFLREMRAAFEGKRRDDFWKLVVERGISLIHSEEAEDSDVSPQEAQQVRCSLSFYQRFHRNILCISEKVHNIF
jgi:hypothetical protein